MYIYLVGCDFIKGFANHQNSGLNIGLSHGGRWIKSPTWLRNLPVTALKPKPLSVQTFHWIIDTLTFTKLLLLFVCMVAKVRIVWICDHFAVETAFLPIRREILEIVDAIVFFRNIAVKRTKQLTSLFCLQIFNATSLHGNHATSRWKISI